MAMFAAYSLFLRFFPAIPFLYFLFAFQIVGFVSFGLAAKRETGGRRLNSRFFWLFVLFATVAVLNDLCYFWGFRLTVVANVAFAHQMVSVFLLFLAPYFLGERTHRNEWIALLIGLAGIGLMYANGVSFGKNDILGVSLGFASAFFYACVIVFYRYLQQEGFSNAQVNAWRYVLSILLVLPFVNSFGSKTLTGTDLAALVAFGVFFAFIAVRFHTTAMKLSRPLHVSIIGKSEPVFVTLYGLLFLGEKPALLAILGGALILLSSLWLALDSRSTS